MPTEDPQQPMPSTPPFNGVPAADTADLGEDLSAEPDLLASAQPAQAEMPSTVEAALADPHCEHISSQPAQDEHLAAGKLSLTSGQLRLQTQSGLTRDDLATLPVLVSALREWLDAQAGRIPGIGDQEVAQV